MTKKYNYISILCGGKCSFNCDFCVGQKIRIDKEPYIDDDWKDFIFENAKYTNEISISGSTSDPFFLGVDRINDILKLSKENNLFTSLHTRSIDLSILRLKNLDELVISINDINPNNYKNLLYLSEKFNCRISIVATKKNKNKFTRNFFYSINIKKWTIRKNIFEKNLIVNIDMPLKKYKIFNAEIYGNEEKEIALWDFKKQNEEIKALYLWQTGQVKEQCYWKNFNIF